MRYFRLIEPVKEAQYIMVDTGKVYERLLVVPGKLYEIPSDIYLKSIKAAPKGKVRYSKGFEDMLKESGAEYTIKKCGSCSGGVKSIIYSRFEVIE